jgi:SpoVK/Ycf46/Vps4 family AAA+-type ATPase
MEGFQDSLHHILAELERIDLLIQSAVSRAREVQGAADDFRGLYIPEQEVDALLSQPAGLPRWAAESGPSALADVCAALDRIAAGIAERKADSQRAGVKLRLAELSRLFDLTPFDTDALLTCLAPEIDLRYEKLFAYLQDDINKKRPSIDLVLNLLSPSFEAKLAYRQRFAPQAPLLRHSLLSLFDDPSQQQPPLLGKYLKVDERVVSYLFESDELDTRLLPSARSIVPRARLDDLLLPADLKRRLLLLALDRTRLPVFYFQGPYGVGKQSAAEALCGETGRRLLIVDGERLLAGEESTFETIVRLSMREALLQDAVLYWDGFDLLLADERLAWRTALLRTLEEQPRPAILAGNNPWEPADAFRARPFVRVEFPRPAYHERIALWQAALGGAALDGAAMGGAAFEAGEDELLALASKFRFSGGQIRDAAATARNLALWREPDGGRVTTADLQAACRLQSNRKLEALARKITPHYAWGDIVLPADRLRQLREICNQVKYRARVYDEWGFDRKLSLGKGLNVLFAGPSGTGKTMAAEIMAGELGLDLYKIDLSTVVSKYIGETEKNLARVFDEAETSNAILFFDEADALFGRRSEVRDSHDRYANIETSYLLQRMEEYDGMAILATNLHKNMDEAFVRRMHFTVEFPFPDAANRQRIWEKIWPVETPQSGDIDLPYMARHFEITGGNIRNIAVAAAFLAADDGQVVSMAHLLAATHREYQKMGKVLLDGPDTTGMRLQRR